MELQLGAYICSDQATPEQDSALVESLHHDLVCFFGRTCSLAPMSSSPSSFSHSESEETGASERVGPPLVDPTMAESRRGSRESTSNLVRQRWYLVVAMTDSHDGANSSNKTCIAIEFAGAFLHLHFLIKSLLIQNDAKYAMVPMSHNDKVKRQAGPPPHFRCSGEGPRPRELRG